MIEMLQMITPMTGDRFKPWLIAICMIASIVVVVGLVVLSVKGKNDNKDLEDNE